jgi:hypothetical protein
VLVQTAQAALHARGVPGSRATGALVLTQATEPIPGLGGRTAFILIAVVVVAIAAVAVIPLIMDVRRATAWRQQLTDRLIDQAGSDQEVRDFLRDLREPRGVRGLTRSIIAILILALVGFALAVAMLSSGADSGDLRKTIVTSLMTVLATVAGFYFGSLGAQNSAEDARRQATVKSSAKAVPGPTGPRGSGPGSAGAPGATGSPSAPSGGDAQGAGATPAVPEAAAGTASVGDATSAAQPTTARGD